MTKEKIERQLLIKIDGDEAESLAKRDDSLGRSLRDGMRFAEENHFIVGLTVENPIIGADCEEVEFSMEDIADFVAKGLNDGEKAADRIYSMLDSLPEIVQQVIADKFGRNEEFWDYLHDKYIGY